MAGILAILWALNGYLTIGGLVVQGAGTIIETFDPAVGEPVKNIGATVAGAGGLRKGVKKYQGKPIF